MSDELPNQNSSNPWEPTPPQPAVPELSNPPDHVVDPVQSWVAQHQKRDENGHFVKSDNLANDSNDQETNSPSNGYNLPTPVSFTQNNKYSEKNDPPLVAVSVTNPVTYLKLFIKRLLKMKV